MTDPAKTSEVSQRKHRKPLTCCRISPNGRDVFAGAEDLHIYRWSLDDKEEPAVVFSGHDSWVRCLDFSQDGRTLFTAGWDGRLGWWDAEASPAPLPPLEQAPGEKQVAPLAAPVRPRRLIQAHDGFCRWVRVSPCGRLVATCGNDLLVKVWDAESGEPLQQFAGHQRHPYAVEFHPQSNHLVSEDLMGQVYRWNLETAKQDGEIDAKIMTGYDKKFAADMGGARDMQFQADGNVLACAGITNVVNAFAGVQDPLTILIDWPSQTITHFLRQAKKATGIAWGIRHHQDGYWLGAISHQSGKGELAFWRLDEEKSEVTPPNANASEDAAAPPEPVELKAFHTVALKSGARGLDLTPDQQRLATAHADGALRIFKLS